jgi:hypothetical protein
MKVSFFVLVAAIAVASASVLQERFPTGVIGFAAQGGWVMSSCLWLNSHSFRLLEQPVVLEVPPPASLH